MFRFLIKRLLQSFLVMLVISFIAFYVSDSLGDPTRELVGNITSEAEREKLREELGLNDPFFTRFTRFLKNAVTGDLGDSFFFKEPVINVILQKFPATFELVLMATLWVILLSFPLGIFAAVNPRHWFTKLIMNLSILGISVPVFLTAIFLIYLFPVTLGWFYSYGRGDLVSFGNWQSSFFTISGWLHIFLPSISLASIMLPLFIRLVRSEVGEVLQSEFVHYARAKGVSRFRVIYVHALRNALLPIVSVGGVQIGTMIAYTILTESVFQWPGMGFMFLEAIKRSDIPLIISYLIFVGLVFVVTNTLVDIIYLIINPTLLLDDVDT